MPIKKVSIKNIEDGGYVFGAAQDREQKAMFAQDGEDFVVIRGKVQIHCQQLQALSLPSRVVPIESVPVLRAPRRVDGPEVEQHRLSMQGR
jgi:hypothetical protein